MGDRLIFNRLYPQPITLSHGQECRCFHPPLKTLGHRDPGRFGPPLNPPPWPKILMPARGTGFQSQWVGINPKSPTGMIGNQPTLKVQRQKSNQPLDGPAQRPGRVHPPPLRLVILKYLPVHNIATAGAKTAQRQMVDRLARYPSQYPAQYPPPSTRQRWRDQSGPHKGAPFPLPSDSGSASQKTEPERSALTCVTACLCIT